METDERAEPARRAKEAGNDAYRKSFLETAVEHYTRGALLDPSDISFLTNRAAAYFHMGKVSLASFPTPLHYVPSPAARPLTTLREFFSVPGVREGLRRGRERGRELSAADNKLVATREGAVAEGVGAARARGLRRGLRAGSQGPAAVAGRTLQRGDA